MKPEINLAPAPWHQLGAGDDLIVTWDAAAVASFSAIGILVGSSRGESDLGSVASVDPTDSFTVAAASLPATGVIYLTAFLDCSAGLFTYDRILRAAGWPPHTVEFAELADEFAVTTALGAVTVEEVREVVGLGWQGLESWSAGLSTSDFTSSGDTSAPNMWGRWRIQYGNPPVVCLDDNHSVTEGWLELAIFQERGSSYTLGKAALALYRVALKDFETATAGAFVFFTESQSQINQDENLGPAMAISLAVPFRGL